MTHVLSIGFVLPNRICTAHMNPGQYTLHSRETCTQLHVHSVGHSYCSRWWCTRDFVMALDCAWCLQHTYHMWLASSLAGHTPPHHIVARVHAFPRIYLLHNLDNNSGVVSGVLSEAQEQVGGWWLVS